MLPAFGGLFSRVGIGGALYVSEFLGAIVMFIGFMRAVTPMKSEAEPPVVTIQRTSSGSPA